MILLDMIKHKIILKIKITHLEIILSFQIIVQILNKMKMFLTQMYHNNNKTTFKLP